MSCTVYIMLVSYKGKNPIKQFFSQRIRDVEQVGRSNHTVIVVEDDNDAIVFQSSFPRPNAMKLKDFMKDYEPVLVYKREVKNQQLMFQMMMWLSIMTTNSSYDYIEDVAIFLKRVFTKCKEIATWKFNHDLRVNCSEFALRFLNTCWPGEFIIGRDEDTIGLREIAEICNRELTLLHQEQVTIWMIDYGIL